MSVPEIPVNEDRHPFPGENEIGRSEDSRMPPPTPDATGPKHGNKAQFSVSISTRADGRHDGRTLFLRENVGHESYV